MRVNAATLVKSMLTSRAKYALRASVALAEQFPGSGWTSASELAEMADVPKKFLEAILTQLRDAGLVESRRGPAGGHRLTAAPAATSVADVIRSIDGPLAMTPCASATAFRACDDCVDIETCRLRHVMRQARDAAAAVLERWSLADVLATDPSPLHTATNHALVPPLGL
jgi:Rrf2 family protein